MKKRVVSFCLVCLLFTGCASTGVKTVDTVSNVSSKADSVVSSGSKAVSGVQTPCFSGIISVGQSGTCYQENAAGTELQKVTVKVTGLIKGEKALEAVSAFKARCPNAVHASDVASGSQWVLVDYALTGTSDTDIGVLVADASTKMQISADHIYYNCNTYDIGDIRSGLHEKAFLVPEDYKSYYLVFGDNVTLDGKMDSGLYVKGE